MIHSQWIPRYALRCFAAGAVAALAMGCPSIDDHGCPKPTTEPFESPAPREPLPRSDVFLTWLPFTINTRITIKDLQGNVVLRDRVRDAKITVSIPPGCYRWSITGDSETCKKVHYSSTNLKLEVYGPKDTGDTSEFSCQWD